MNRIKFHIPAISVKCVSEPKVITVLPVQGWPASKITQPAILSSSIISNITSVVRLAWD